MKQMIIFLLAAILTMPLDALAQLPLSENNDVLYVAATSGLRLRMHPNMESGTVRIIPFGDTVEIVRDNPIDISHSDRIDWLEGYWTRIRYKGSAGYVFDGFLSHLSPPDHEEQLCFTPNTLIRSINTYVEQHFLMLCIEEQVSNEKDISSFVTTYERDVQSIITSGEGWHRYEFVFTNTRYSEILHLMRQLVVGENLRNELEHSLVFHTGPTGKVTRINIEFGDFPMVLDIRSDDVLILSSTIHTVDDFTASY